MLSNWMLMCNGLLIQEITMLFSQHFFFNDSSSIFASSNWAEVHCQSGKNIDREVFGCKTNWFQRKCTENMLWRSVLSAAIVENVNRERPRVKKQSSWELCPWPFVIADVTNETVSSPSLPVSTSFFFNVTLLFCLSLHTLQYLDMPNFPICSIVSNVVYWHAAVSTEIAHVLGCMLKFSA